jgi:hypothetical protein
MRARYVIAVLAVILLGFGVKLFFFSVPTAEADIRGVTHKAAMFPISIQDMHSNAHMEGLPIQNFQSH